MRRASICQGCLLNFAVQILTLELFTDGQQHEPTKSSDYFAHHQNQIGSTMTFVSSISNGADSYQVQDNNNNGFS